MAKIFLENVVLTAEIGRFIFIFKQLINLYTNIPVGKTQAKN